MHYIHSVAFIPLHFKFKMKTSVKINLKVLFVNNYDWTEPPNLWHFTNEIRIKAFQTRNNNFAIFSLMSIASAASLKIEMPLKMLLKMHTCTCTMYHMWYVLYILSLNFTEKQLVWVAEFVQHKLNWLSSYIVFLDFTDLVLGRGRIRKIGRLTRLASWCLPGLFKTSLSISLFQLCTHIMKCKRMMITSLQELPLSWIIFH